MKAPLTCWFRDEDPGPATHALVIGVSHYPHRPLGVDDLPGAAVSADLFARWLRGRYPGRDRRLGSIRLLLAPSGDERPDVSAGPGVHLPDRATVHQALNEWAWDCMSSPDNVAVLYVCGHGVQEADDGVVVFMHDAGAVPDDVLDGALDVAGVRAGLKGDGSPARQWYFADACRVPSADLIGLEGPAQGGITLKRRRGSAVGHRPIFFATTPGGESWQSRAGSVFVQALRDCLELHALVPLKNAAGGWGITAQSLGEALDVRVRELAALDDREQAVVVGGSLTNATFLEREPPLVPVTLVVSPAEAQEVEGCGAEIFDGDTARRILERRPLPVADVPVLGGFWTLAVTFDPPCPPYIDKPAIAIQVHPPRVEQTVTLR
ncbi:caspase family protein [Dactylosporangium sp. CA-092794]|uniref:caspase family protein n=1 Tax=Dactylosporangium sp. CA-092794 TaxID=3239929 RepID=UPI003D9045C4